MWAFSNDTPYMKVFEAITKKWACTTRHAGKTCYVPPGSSRCILLTAAEIGVWATAIRSGAATLANPPRNPEFDEKIYGSKAIKAASTANAIHGDRNVGSAGSSVVQNFYGYTKKSPPSTPTRPARDTTSTLPAITPMREFGPFDYTREGLYQYLEYLEDKFEDPKYRSAYSILCENDLGIDIISQASADFNREQDLIHILEGLSLTAGLSRRLVRTFNEWRVYKQRVERAWAPLQQQETESVSSFQPDEDLYGDL
jgi:hypothetical protein